MMNYPRQRGRQRPNFMRVLIFIGIMSMVGPGMFHFMGGWAAMILVILVVGLVIRFAQQVSNGTGWGQWGAWPPPQPQPPVETAYQPYQPYQPYQVDESQSGPQPYEQGYQAQSQRDMQANGPTVEPVYEEPLVQYPQEDPLQELPPQQQ